MVSRSDLLHGVQHGLLDKVLVADVDRAVVRAAGVVHGQERPVERGDERLVGQRVAHRRRGDHRSAEAAAAVCRAPHAHPRIARERSGEVGGRVVGVAVTVKGTALVGVDDVAGVGELARDAGDRGERQGVASKSALREPTRRPGAAAVLRRVHRDVDDPVAVDSGQRCAGSPCGVSGSVTLDPMIRCCGLLGSAQMYSSVSASRGVLEMSTTGVGGAASLATATSTPATRTTTTPSASDTTARSHRWAADKGPVARSPPTVASHHNSGQAGLWRERER